MLLTSATSVVSVVCVCVCVDDDLKSLRLPCLAVPMGWTPVFASIGKVLRMGWNDVHVQCNVQIMAVPVLLKLITGTSIRTHDPACSPRECDV
jgi:hypothetical protein